MLPTPTCEFDHAGIRCGRSGDHLCDRRAERVRGFFADVLCHTKGKYAGQPFVLEDWQYGEIVRPLFGRVVWSVEHDRYVRQYSRAWIEIGRKNGKSEIMAGIMLYLLVADGEESAELYGIAYDKKQAGLVYEVVKRMVQLSPALRRRLRVPTAVQKMTDPKTNSFYMCLASNEGGALGSNPSGVAADEILAWRSRGMWDAMETGMGSDARVQPLLVAATTAGVTDDGFAETMHRGMLEISENPKLSPHTFVFIRNTPPDVDIYDESNWYHANPALGSFLSLAAMRRAAADAKLDKGAEQAFKQFRLNMWTKAAFRWMEMDEYDAATSTTWSRPDLTLTDLRGERAFVGMDLSAKMDLTAVAYCLPDTPAGPSVVWRFYAPEAAVEELDRKNDGKFSQFVRDGWLTMCDGEVIDYDEVIDDMARMAKIFKIRGLDADEWSTWPIITRAARALGVVWENTTEPEVDVYKNTYTSMSPALGHVMELVKTRHFNHFGNPLARLCFDSTQVRRSLQDPDLIRPDKPDRLKASYRIDGVPAAAMAVSGWKNRGQVVKRRSAYADRGVIVAR